MHMFHIFDKKEVIIYLKPDFFESDVTKPITFLLVFLFQHFDFEAQQ